MATKAERHQEAVNAAAEVVDRLAWSIHPLAIAEVRKALHDLLQALGHEKLAGRFEVQ